MLFFVAWVLQDWSKIVSWFFFGCIWVCGMGFLVYFVVSSIDGWFGCVNIPFAGFLCKICNSFRWFCRREEDMKKKRDYGSFNIASSLQYFWKIEGDGKRREEERKWFFFSIIILLSCRVRIGWHKTHLLSSSWPNLIPFGFVPYDDNSIYWFFTWILFSQGELFAQTSELFVTLFPY